MKKIIILGGPTASGKSKFALKLSKLVNGEIVNGDSKPYKYLNKSIEDFYTQEQISKKLLNNKFSNIYKEDILSGILSIHHAWKLND